MQLTRGRMRRWGTLWLWMQLTTSFGISSEASLANLGKLFTPGFEKLIIVSPTAIWEIIMIALTPMPFMLRPFYGSLSNFQLRWHCWSPRWALSFHCGTIIIMMRPWWSSHCQRRCQEVFRYHGHPPGDICNGAVFHSICCLPFSLLVFFKPSVLLFVSNWLPALLAWFKWTLFT